jgi:hypothetical protein
VLVTIQVGRRLRIDIRADKDLLDRVRALETEAERLAEDLRQLEASQEDYLLADDAPEIELVEEYIALAEKLRQEASDLGFWKADRNHSHPQYAEKAPTESC